MSSDEDAEYQIQVLNLDGRTLFCTVTGDWTVLQLKNTVAVSEGVPAEEQRLIFGGKHLQDDFTLHESGVQSGSTVHLMLRLQG